MFSYFENYPTFLVFMAVVIGVLVTMLLTPVLIRILRRENIGQQVRDDGPQTHLVKSGTPTMGGIVMLIAVVAAGFVVGVPDIETYILIAAVVLTGIVGLIDDVSSIAHERSLGLTPKAKLAFQFAISLTFILCAVNMLDIQPTVEIPFICTLDLGILTTTIPLPGGAEMSIPWLYVVFDLILLMGLSNAVNLTDGLDGLAGGTVMIVMIVMAAIAFRENLLEPAIFSAAIAGACVGFLWFNSHPADIFMGDTGSLALGQALGCLAVVTKTEFIVLIIGALFVAEALSVMIQVAWFKRTGERVFLMAPLHHHFEKKGWSETKVVVRFWIISGLLAACGFVLYFSSSMVTG
ncbi:MAG: phospho-N-acetylmuramoyl-pentapeptide-transferase [Eggerthellaceae bacterium]|nr:phospho-N-acetylmuramoyl-pentapeptide-transferase [Eggerthellaceae bacterium]